MCSIKAGAGLGVSQFRLEPLVFVLLFGKEAPGISVLSLGWGLSEGLRHRWPSAVKIVLYIKKQYVKHHKLIHFLTEKICK